MQTYIAPGHGWLLLLFYGSAMTLLVWLGTRPDKSAEQHLVADRAVGPWAGAFSIAVTWIWAPAIFICSQKSYQQGIAGIFWFTLPNIACFFTFVPIALALRRRMTKGYSMPDYVWQRYHHDPRAHSIALFISLGYSLSAIIANSLAGGLLLHKLSGMNQPLAIIAFAAVALFYSAWRGLPASIITDVVQMCLILFIAFILVPWTLSGAGGWSALSGGSSGIAGSNNPLDPWIAYSFGIPVTIGLIAGPICDQMFYQRAMAARKDSIASTFILGGLLFSIVPIILSVFGFIAANPKITPLLDIGDPQLVSVEVVGHFLPNWTLLGFALMALCGLSSTLDSAYCAAGSLWAVDIYGRYFNKKANDRDFLRASKAGMAAIGIGGTAIAIVPGLNLLWVFMSSNALAAGVLVPVITSVYWPRSTARGFFLGALTAVLFGFPLSIYANASGSANLLVLAYVGPILCSLLIIALDALGALDILFAPHWTVLSHAAPHAAPHKGPAV